ncbi:uncharacterized protein LOC131927460 [Physella acuta]|uniref:uncharacterized protein LOC131927460 n=1 Tax=Physella acuta TaxID=109671 RepID=UPI0027DC645B|nr:uncharacterized protein LOC131927460 [Physella acuta]
MTISTDSVPSNTTTDPAPSETAPPLPAPRILPRCPPDYIDVTSSGCHGNQEGELYVPYEFPPPRPEILESLCFIQDPIPDREKCLHQLECTLTPGAYLVRNSRQSNLKILAYLSSDGTVREYKVLEQDARFTLDMEAFFASIGELLAFYMQTTIPGTNDLLKQGIHEFV